MLTNSGQSLARQRDGALSSETMVNAWRRAVTTACTLLTLLALARPAAAASAPGSTTLGPLRHVTQTLNNCGPASVAEVLDYWGIEKTQGELAAILRHGTALMSTDDVADYLPTIGLREYIGNSGTDSTLKTLLDNGLPVIVAQSVTLLNSFPHFRPIEAYDDGRQQFTASDPLLGAGYRMTYASFDKMWAESDNTFLVIYPPTMQHALDAAISGSGFDGLSWMTPFD